MIIEKGEIHFAIENKLAHKLDLVAKRITSEHPRQNAYLENHGKPGDGKTNTAVVEAYYMHLQTGRPIHLFFKLSNLLEFAKKTQDQIIIWDEPSLDSLSTDHLARINRDLLRLINTGRKLRHFYIINFTKFWRFPEDIVVDTCLGMVHMNSRNGTTMGRFLYIPQKKLESLWTIYQKTGKKSYGKLKAFGGGMPYVMEKYMHLMNITIEGHPNCGYNDYNRLKDEAIASIGVVDAKKSKKESEVERKLIELRYKLGNITTIQRETLAAALGISSVRLFEWRKRPPEGANPLENEVLETTSSTSTWNTMDKDGKNESAAGPASPGPIINNQNALEPINNSTNAGQQPNKPQTNASAPINNSTNASGQALRTHPAGVKGSEQLTE